MVRYAPGVYEQLQAEGKIGPGSMPTNLSVGSMGPKIPSRGGPRAMIPEQGPLGPGLIGGQPLPEINPRAMETIQKQYGQYGFSDDIMNFLARNQQLGYIDAGKNISYDPDSQTFSVGQGGRMNPTGESLKFNIDEFTNYIQGALKPPSRPEIQPGYRGPIDPYRGPLSSPAIQGPITPGVIGTPGNVDPIKPGTVGNIVSTPGANGVGIGSLTQNPINTTPESNIMGSMTSSPYLNNNQYLDQYLNSYVENLINRRMRDIFGGIMSIFQ